MLKILDRLSPDIDTIIICTDVPLLRYFVQTKLEQLYNVDKNYSIPVETGVLYKKVKNDALVAPLLGDRWLITANVDKVGVETVLSLLNWGNGNGITLLYTEKYLNYKKLINSDKYKAVKPTVMTLYLGKFDMEDIPYLYKSIVVENSSSRLTDDLLNFLCKNYRYDVERVMNLFSKMKIGLTVETRQDLIDEVGLGGVTPASYTIDLLRLFQTTGKYKTAGPVKITEKKIDNARKKYLNLLRDLSNKVEYRTIYNQMKSTLRGILDMKMLIMNGGYRRTTKIIPESFTKEQIGRLKALQRFDYPIREEISLNRVLALLTLFDKQPVTFDYEFVLIELICTYISMWECEIDDCEA